MCEQRVGIDAGRELSNSVFEKKKNALHKELWGPGGRASKRASVFALLKNTFQGALHVSFGAEAYGFIETEGAKQLPLNKHPYLMSPVVNPNKI